MKSAVRGQGPLQVVFCRCGKLHVTYRALTLHFEREEFLLCAESVGRSGAMVKPALLGSALAPGLSSGAKVCH